MPHLCREIEEGVVTFTLDVPDKKNALTAELRAELLEGIRHDEADAAVRAIVLAGAGGTFCSGGDIALMGEGDEADRRRRLAILHEVVRLLVAGRKPVVAAVAGAAYGGGFSLAMAADYVVADTTARFCASFGQVGLMGDMGLLWTLPQRIGHARTRQLVMDGRVLVAGDALHLGIVDRLVLPGELQHAARETAIQASSMAPLPIAATKAIMADGLNAALATEMEAQMRLFASRDHVEARAAFLDRRQPTYTGR